MRDDAIIGRNLAEHLRVVDQLSIVLSEQIGVIGALLASALSQGGTIFWCGNGGSAADSQHLSAELVGRFKKNRRALKSIALTSDGAVLTCVANDYDYANIFSRQIEGLGRKGDVLVGITTSGSSENVTRAIRAAKDIGMITVALLGKGGGTVKGLVDHALVIPSDSTARIQEAHMLIGHIICDIIEHELGLSE